MNSLFKNALTLKSKNVKFYKFSQKVFKNVLTLQVYTGSTGAHTAHTHINQVIWLFLTVHSFWFACAFVCTGNSATKTESSTLDTRHETKDDSREVTRPSRPAVSNTHLHTFNSKVEYIGDHINTFTHSEWPTLFSELTTLLFIFTLFLFSSFPPSLLPSSFRAIRKL